MFGGEEGYFYNGTIRRSVAIFGTLFNKIFVGRSDSSGNLTNQQRVPIAYGPRQKWLARLQERSELTDEKVAITLPRMSFEDQAPMFDAERQLPKLQSRNLPSTTDNGSVVAKVWQPAAYRIPFELSIYTRNKDEALQIVEQIMPYFRPSFGIRIKPVPGMEIIDDAKIILQSISYEDDVYGDAAQRRILITTLTFDFLFNLYGRIDQNSKVIKTAIVDFLEMDTNERFEKGTWSVDPTTADEEDPHTIDVTWELGNE